MTDTNTTTNYQRIIESLRNLRNREERLSLVQGTYLAVAVLAATVLLALFIEAVTHLDVTWRTVLFGGVITAGIVVVGRFLLPHALKRFGLTSRKSEDTIALEVGSHFPDIKDRLLNVLQIVRQSDAKPRYSPLLVDASFREVADAFSRLNLDPIVDKTPARKAGKLTFFAVGAAFAAFALFPQTLFDAAHRIIHFRTDFAPPAPFDFIVEPGDIEVVRGEQIVLSATTTARIKPEVTFFIREKGQDDFDAIESQSGTPTNRTYTINGVRNSFTYYADADGYRSRMYHVNVVDRPFIRSMRLKLTFPSYTGLPQRYLDENVGDVTALTGTTISFDLMLNKEVAEATLVLNDSHRVEIPVQGVTAQTKLRLMKDGSYAISLKDQSGIENANPIVYEMKVVPDLYPTIEILEPAMNTDINEAMRMPIIAGATDDFGFSKLLLHYRLASSRYEQPQEAYASIVIPLPSQRGKEIEIPYLWNLTSLNLAPEDVVNYYLEIFDNDNVSGPKSTRSQVFSVRLPSLEEVFAKADKAHERSIDNLQKTLRSAQEVQKEMETLQRELKQKNTDKLDWQQQKKLEDLAKRHEGMMKDVEKVNEELKRLQEDLQQQNVISPETMKKYQELNDLMKKLESPEFKEILKKLNEGMQNLTPEQMKQAMENFKMNEEAFRKSIERTIELLKRLQIEQKVDELTRRSEDLAKKQQDLAERTENADPKNQEELDRLAKEQEELRKQTENMQREMKELEEKMQEFAEEMPLHEMQEAQGELNLAEMQQQMSESASQCQGGNCQGASKSMKKMAEQMRKFEQKMKKVQKKMSEDQKRAIMQAFKKALENVLTLSKKQEQMKQDIASLPVNSPQFREATQQQMDLMEQLSNTANDLMELAKKTFAVNEQMGRHIGEAMQKMKRAMENMQQRNNQSAGQEQGGAMASLNEAARQIAKGMQASQQGGSQGGSLMQQLQAMAQRQMGINQGSQQFGQQQGQYNQQQLAQMQRLAQQQAALQKSLEELNKEAKRSEEGRRILGDLERIAQEMQEIVSDLQQQEINPNTLQKQERILSRLLDASRSMRERDWEKKRKSETGTDVARRSPGELDPSLLDPANAMKSDLQKAIEEGYSRDYEQLIRKYFEALQKIVTEDSKRAPQNQ